MLAKAVAKEADANFINISMSSITSKVTEYSMKSSTDLHTGSFFQTCVLLNTAVVW